VFETCVAKFVQNIFILYEKQHDMKNNTNKMT